MILETGNTTRPSTEICASNKSDDLVILKRAQRFHLHEFEKMCTGDPRWAG